MKCTNSYTIEKYASCLLIAKTDLKRKKLYFFRNVYHYNMYTKLYHDKGFNMLEE